MTLGAWVVAAALIPLVSAAAPPDAARPAAAANDGLSKALHQLFTDEQAFTWREDPLTASYDGVSTYDDRLESDVPADFERRAGANAKFLERLHALNRAQLSGEDQISYDLFDFILTSRVKFAAYDRASSTPSAARPQAARPTRAQFAPGK